MSVWTEQVDTSLIVERLNELGPAIDQALGWKTIDASAAEGLERIRTVLTFIGKRVDGLDGALLRPGSLAPIAGNVAAATENVKAFSTDGASGHLDAAHAQIDAALASFATLVLPTKTNELRGLREAAEAYRETMSNGLAKLQAEVADKQTRLDALTGLLKKAQTDFEGTEATLQAELQTFRDQITGAQGTLTLAYAGAEQRLGEAVTARLDEWRSVFDAAEKARADEYKADADEQAKECDALVEKYESIFNATDATWDQRLADLTKGHDAAYATLQKDYQEKGAELVTNIEAQLTEASELVDVIADRAVTSGHKQAADHARTQVVFWQGLTVVAMLTLVGFAGATALDFMAPATFTWLTFARRVYFSIAVGILAAYGASQANRYQQIERRNRKLELELKALEPFLKQVTPEQREPFRLKMAEAFFGRDETGPHDPGPTNALQLFKSKEHLEALADGLKLLLDRLKK